MNPKTLKDFMDSHINGMTEYCSLEQVICLTAEATIRAVRPERIITLEEQEMRKMPTRNEKIERLGYEKALALFDRKAAAFMGEK